MRAAKDGTANRPLFHYTQMPTHIDRFFSTNEKATMSWHPGFTFTKGTPVMKIDASLEEWWWEDFETMLFDLHNDPEQKIPISDGIIEAKMVSALIDAMRRNDAPTDQYERLGLV